MADSARKQRALSALSTLVGAIRGPATCAPLRAFAGRRSQVASASLFLFDDLDEIAARVVEHGDGDVSHGRGMLREMYAGCTKPGMLCLHVVDREEGAGYSVLFKGGLERLRSGMRVWLQ